MDFLIVKRVLNNALSKTFETFSLSSTGKTVNKTFIDWDLLVAILISSSAFILSWKVSSALELPLVTKVVYALLSGALGSIYIVCYAMFITTDYNALRVYDPLSARRR
jgi:hypothetical protein